MENPTRPHPYAHRKEAGCTICVSPYEFGALCSVIPPFLFVVQHEKGPRPQYTFRTRRLWRSCSRRKAGQIPRA